MQQRRQGGFEIVVAYLNVPAAPTVGVPFELLPTSGRIVAPFGNVCVTVPCARSNTVGALGGGGGGLNSCNRSFPVLSLGW